MTSLGVGIFAVFRRRQSCELEVVLEEHQKHSAGGIPGVAKAVL
jgi:hypothetical protein